MVNKRRHFTENRTQFTILRGIYKLFSSLITIIAFPLHLWSLWLVLKLMFFMICLFYSQFIWTQSPGWAEGTFSSFSFYKLFTKLVNFGARRNLNIHLIWRAPLPSSLASSEQTIRKNEQSYTCQLEKEQNIESKPSNS